MSEVLILATADVHSPEYLNLYVSSIAKVKEKPDLILWVGDMVKRGRVDALRPVLEYTRKFLKDVPIYSIFGNEEYLGLEDKFKKMYPDVNWIDNEYVIVEIKNKPKLAIIGTRGALDRLTTWQRSHRPELAKVYRELPKLIGKLVKEARNKADIVIVVSHYTIGFKTCIGEPRMIWPELGSKAMEEAIKKFKPDAVIHGHAHKSRVLESKLNSIPIYNVSIVARKGVALLRLGRKPMGLERYLKLG